jgi:type I restriction enzyme S subunit
MSETLEAIAKALFKSWFVDFDPVRAKQGGRQPEGMYAETAALCPDGFEDSELGEVPRGWTVSQIGLEVDVVGGSTPSTKEPSFWDGHIHWVTPKDLSALSNPILLDTERKITELGLAEIGSGLLPVGTVLMSSRAPIGYLAVSQIPVATNQGFISMKCTRQLSSWYVLHWAEHNMEAIKGRANGTTFLEVSKANFRTLPILVPDAGSLRAFETFAGGIYARVVANLEESRTLVALRDALLPRLLSGDLGTGNVAEAYREVT